MKKSTLTMFSACLMISACLSFSCSKKEKPTPTEPEPEKPIKEEPKPLIEEKDITSLATLFVSTENQFGKASKEGSPKLIDNDKATKYLIQSYTPAFYIQFSFAEPKLIASYAFTSGDDADGRDPENWTVTGSLDGSTWVQLDKQDYEFFPERTQTKRYYFVNPTAYKYYRVNITGIRGGGLFQLSELRLFQMPSNLQKVLPFSTTETITAGKNTLIFVNKSNLLTLPVKNGLINVFKENYQRMADLYNPDAKTKVVFVVDAAYEGVAAAFGGAVIRYDPDWFVSNPTDLDVATHELMHVVQSYPYVADAGWVTEGIADYVRFTHGLTNPVAKWTLPAFSSNQSYKDAYRVTARFFLWLEKNGYEGIVIKLDKSMRTAAYTTATFWPANTGKTIDQLWADYAANPNQI
ncbi:basic secretory protein-like protein [Pedobacter faecalis]|uniref:basic secretory protein-like protein n=1 Tax=Pedobacter faecalis TaxID=3041495 RepID=UPI00254F5E8D|nr:basic secretory protein-like protein [Pedobacter sp. ELA7]